MDDEEPSGSGSAVPTASAGPPSIGPDEEGADSEAGRQDSAPPGAVATVWLSIPTAAHRRLGEIR
ncbi:hypothetical protein ACOMD4_23895 [Streptomyces anulatus]|uniref:hypothetical protein n=1 Tax=Streptomyces anulatus TaxID=1892 RepID=UPI0036253B4F